MAAGEATKHFCEMVTCPICQEFFSDPVSIAECGHSFCRACLTGSWGASGAEVSCCPQCRGSAQEGTLRPNQQLASFAEVAKKCSPRGGKGGEGKEAICEKHQEPLEFFCKVDRIPICLVCDRAKEHRNHQTFPLEEVFQEDKTVIKAEERRVCEKHQEPLKLFCKDDDVLICTVCDRTKEHNYHEVIPIEEAAREFKKTTKAEKEKAVAEFRQLHQFLEQQEKLLLTQMEETEKEIARRREEHLAKLSEELSSLQCLIREMERKCHQADGELLQEIKSDLQRCKKKFENPETFPSELRWKIWDLRHLRHPFLESVMKKFKACSKFFTSQGQVFLTVLAQTDTSGGSPPGGRDMAPKGPKSIPYTALNGLIPVAECTENLDTNTDSLSLTTFHGKLCTISVSSLEQERPISPLLLKGSLPPFFDGLGKVLRDRPDLGNMASLVSGPKLKAANVTLDPDTANSKLILSGDRKSVRLGNEAQALPDNPKRFNSLSIVLGREGFTSGQHFWEVTVGSRGEWSLGVARESVNRKQYIRVAPWNGIWAVEKTGSECYAQIKAESFSALTVQLRRIRVCLNYDKQQVAFFDADTAAPLCTFSEASFSGETLFPFFLLHFNAQLDLSF
uniref:E3 ubiquitin-protein ligase TRIM7-like n=1 Tax=Euleptes europaea TaxID=460621 RepID=UPI002541763A|nr:E3 ubiquitin-protein ligase TRIM7-like [Euleptes europaea]